MSNLSDFYESSNFHRSITEETSLSVMAENVRIKITQQFKRDPFGTEKSKTKTFTVINFCINEN